MFCPRTKLRGLAVYEDDSLKDDKPGAGTVLRASYKFYFESAHELRRRRRENLRLKNKLRHHVPRHWQNKSMKQACQF